MKNNINVLRFKNEVSIEINTELPVNKEVVCFFFDCENEMYAELLKDRICKILGIKES